MTKYFLRKMILFCLITLSLCGMPAYADICGELVNHLSISMPGGSYISDGLCVGLFWKGPRMQSDICAKYDGLTSYCPAERQVTTLEAFSLMIRSSLIALRGRRGLPTTTPIPQHEAVYEIIAFGDWGDPRHPNNLKPVASLISDWYKATGSVFLLGDNFYPKGINVSLGVSDPAFRLFSRILAPSTPANFYVLFGNHDYMGSPDAQLEYTNIHPQWKFPSPYYFKAFRTSAGRICSWFLDTNVGQFDEIQARWLKHTMRDEVDDCAYRIVSGHHPIFDGGEYRSNQHLITHLLPILTLYKVHLYLSGHEHQSQILISPEHPTVFLITGAIADIRPPMSRGHEYLQYINMNNEAILRLGFFQDRIEYSFIPTALEKRRKSEPPKPLAFGTVPRNIAS